MRIFCCGVGDLVARLSVSVAERRRQDRLPHGKSKCVWIILLLALGLPAAAIAGDTAASWSSSLRVSTFHISFTTVSAASTS